MSKRKREDGAAAVEFALLATIFITLLFGIIDYGLYFNDSNSTRNGVRETARQGVVSNWSTCGTGTSLDHLRCRPRRTLARCTGTRR